VTAGVQETADLFSSGYSCSEAMLMAYAPSLGLDRATAQRLMLPLAPARGSRPSTCCAFTAAALIIGLHAEHTIPEDREARARTAGLVQQLAASFEARYGSLECRSLLGCDVGTQEGRTEYVERDLRETSCAGFVRETAVMLDEILASSGAALVAPPSSLPVPAAAGAGVVISSARAPIYLNNAATSWPKPDRVVAAVAETLRATPTGGGRASDRQGPDTCPLGPVVRECRRRLASLLYAQDPSRIVLTPSVTHALNAALWGLGWNLPRGAHIITSVAEHNAVLRPLRYLLKRRPDLRLTLVGLRASGGFDRGQIADALEEGASLVVLMHASNVTGRVYDIAPLFAAAKASGAVTVLDAAQSLGHVPVQAEALSADVVAFTGHKGLRGPLGVGGLYVGPGIELEPIIAGGTGADSTLLYQPDELPARLEAGTPNLPAVAGLVAALRWQASEGGEFERRGKSVSTFLRGALRRIPGVEILDEAPTEEWLGVTLFRIAGQGVEAVGEALADRYNVVCRTGLHCAPLLHEALGSGREGGIRFSPSGYTSEADIEAAIAAVAELAAS
jgi:cysteine desulfurase / selenocysteine lyase